MSAQMGQIGVKYEMTSLANYLQVCTSASRGSLFLSPCLV